MRRRSYKNKQTIKQNSFLQTESGLLTYLLIRSNFRRTLSIAVDERAQVQVSVPLHCPDVDVHGFITQKSRWIFEKMEEARKNQTIISSKRFDNGHEFLFLGKNFRLTVDMKDIRHSRIDFDGTQWKVELPSRIEHGKKEQVVRLKMLQWYRQQAQEILGGRVFHFAKIMDLAPQRIAIRSFKRLWGNCDYNTRSIQINWQIILTPMSVIDYVVVHELCHLVHPNHSQRFWRKVQKYIPDFQDQKRWLNDHCVNLTLP